MARVTPDPSVPLDPPVPGALRAAALILALEAAALVGAAVVLVVKTLTGNPDSSARALLAATMAVFGAVVLAAGGRGLQRARATTRTPVVVLQLLAVPVAYSLWFQAGLPVYGAPIMLAAVAILYLVFTPAARSALGR